MVMEVLYYSMDKPFELDNSIALALGYFDGLHLGHIALASKVKEYARLHKTKSALMTFSPNPLITLGKIEEEYYLTSFEDRAKLLEELGIDYLIILDFNKKVSELSPKDFYQQFIDPLKVECIVCGFDYHFGSKGRGDGHLLRELAMGKCEVYIQEEVLMNHQKISSSRIQEALKNGNIEEANVLLNRPYSIKGEIIKGRQIGRTIGFPTANIDYDHYAIPKNGVYGVKIEVNNKMYVGMCNIGYNPTFDSLDKTSLEVNIFDFDAEVYGNIAKVYFYTFIRDEVKFSSAQALITQLNQDKDRIIHYFTMDD